MWWLIGVWILFWSLVFVRCIMKAKEDKYDIQHHCNTPEVMVVEKKTGRQVHCHIDKFFSLRGDYDILFKEKYGNKL